MKKLLAFSLVLAFVFMLAACSGAKSSDPTLGTYKGVHYKCVGDEEWEEEEFSVELSKNGKGVSRRDGEEYEMTWTLEGEDFTMTETFMGIKLDYTGALKNGELHIYNGDPTNPFTTEYVYHKVEKPE